MDTKNRPNRIKNPEQAAKVLFGFDDETLLREWEEAEQELEQMKDRNPELIVEMEQEAEVGFQALMQRIHAEKRNSLVKSLTSISAHSCMPSTPAPIDPDKKLALHRNESHPDG